MNPFPLLVTVAVILGGCVLPIVPTPPEPETVTAKPWAPTCAGKLPRKVLLTAFPLRYPEQIKTGEFFGWPQLTSEELAQALNRSGWLKADAAPHQFPFEEPASSIALSQQHGKPAILAWAKQANAQYVVTGLFHDIGQSKHLGVVPEQQLKLEAFVFDGNDGSLLARQEFLRQFTFGSLPKTVIPGSRAFTNSRLGKTYHELLTELSHWTTDIVTCQPYAARVTQVDGKRITLGTGSNHGITTDMAWQLWRPGTPPPRPTPGNLVSAKPIPTAVIKEVHPETSIAEITPQRFPPVLKVGDVLYLTEPTQPVVTPAVTPAVTPTVTPTVTPPPAIPPARNKL